MSTSLCLLAKKYGVDKCPSINHDYTPTYDSVLSPMKHSTKLVLEIGIGNMPLMKPIVGTTYKPGASLRMWRDYFPSATIVGCDILTSVLFNDEDRINTFYADQSDKASLINLVENNIKPQTGYIDVIVDDGSHIEAHQRFSFEVLWKYVRPNGGIYIIEDVWITNLDRMGKLPTFLNFTDAELIRKYNDGKDKQGLVVFRKK